MKYAIIAAGKSHLSWLDKCSSLNGDGLEVLLGFRHGDPARPYILDSLFNGVTGKGGFAANHKKSLTTRSGSNVTLSRVIYAKALMPGPLP